MGLWHTVESDPTLPAAEPASREPNKKKQKRKEEAKLKRAKQRVPHNQYT